MSFSFLSSQTTFADELRERKYQAGIVKAQKDTLKYKEFLEKIAPHLKIIINNIPVDEWRLCTIYPSKFVWETKIPSSVSMLVENYENAYESWLVQQHVEIYERGGGRVWQVAR